MRTGRLTPGLRPCAASACARRNGDLHGSGARGMNIIFFSKREGLARQLNLAHPLTLGVLGVLVIAILGTAFALGMQLGTGSNGKMAQGDAARWMAILADQKHQIADLKERMNERVDAMAMRMGEVNAHVIRLDALGKRLTELAAIDSHEFNFDSAPP